MHQQQILELLQQPGYQPAKLKEISRQLKLGKADRPQLQESLDALLAANLVFEDRKGRFRLKNPPGTLLGIVKRISSGAGFFTPHNAGNAGREQDIYISPEDMRDAHSGDEVMVRILKRRRSGGQRCGRIEEIIERASNTFVGTYFEEHGQGWVRVDGRVFEHPIQVGDPGAKGAAPEDKVVIEMLEFPRPGHTGEAVLTKVLGAKGEVGVDTASIIHEFHLPQEFPEAVLHEARGQAELLDETIPPDREDLTKETIITIDPIDARDFDDAISLKRDKKGHWNLGVHIADVSHFVQFGSALDREAQLRGTSVYLPGQVIPMIPELISNGLASLQQGKLRYVKSVFIEFSPEGVPLHTRLANAVIKVNRRFAYEQVMPILENPEEYKTRVPAKIRKLLAEMQELARILRARRYAKGALEMNMPEVDIDFDKEGKVVGAHESHHDESHEIIEEFMLAANIAVATELNDRGLPFLRRIHPDPHPVKLNELVQFASHLGYDLPEHPGRPDLQKLIKEVQGSPQERAVNYSLLRSLKQAQYSAIDMGHFALAEKNYCHFTSPIRRYPDLLVHRIVDSLIRKLQPKLMSERDLVMMGKHCSTTERRAESAERELVRVKLMTFMAGKINEVFEAVITGVEAFGVFCQCVEVPAEGLVKVDKIQPRDYYEYDSDTLSMIGRQKGTVYRLGDRVKVQVLAVDIDRRELDLTIVELIQHAPEPKRKKKKPKPSASDKASARDRSNGKKFNSDKKKSGKTSQAGKPRKEARGRKGS